MFLKFFIIVFIFFHYWAFLLGESFYNWLAHSKVSLKDSNERTLQVLDQTKLEWPNKEWKEVFLSSLSFANPNFLPIRDWTIEEPNTEARAALVFELDRDKILYQKNIDQPLPIASLTKIMTALIVLENADLGDIVVVTEEALAGYGEQGGLAINERISVKNLLYALLMESSNDAAIALAQYIERISNHNFVDLMNQKAAVLGLEKTHFIDPAGYQPANISTAQELVHLIQYSFQYPLLWQIMKTPVIDLFSADGQIVHHWVNTDELLNRMPEIIGGKTGYTEEAKGCLVLVVQKEGRFSKSRVATVILGAQERFLETERLINWVKKAYKW